MMLAYVFWHWKQPAVDIQHYERWARGFHAALAAHPPTGFVQSFAYAVAGVPWVAQGQPAYEDWYLVHDSAALDRLNDAAISAQRQQPHDTIANVAAGGTAGLYRLRQGELPAAAPRFATWLSKPDGTSYPTFFERLQPVTAQPHTRLWGRQMTLGPTPEFCLHSSEPVTLPDLPAAYTLELRSIWPE